MKSTNQIARTFLAIATAVIAFAGAANAQSPYQGKFTLPEATRWGQIELPAGNYTFSVKASDTNTPFVIIADAGGKSVGITQPMTTDATSQVNGQDCLVLEHASKGSFVSQVRLGSAMVVLGYAPNGRRNSKEAEQAQIIRINPTGRQAQSGSRS